MYFVDKFNRLIKKTQLFMSKFQFKQFSIEQDRCAMKIGTDGVLLGAQAP
jgi:tRNA1(Val) A37 N6-methylase TrmN6